MAYSAGTIWNIQVGGSNANGAAFDPTMGGTDYSQGLTPFFVYTDLVLVTTTTASSVLRPFIAADVGNSVFTTMGVGFNGGRAQIISVSAGVATFDKALGTAASAGGHGNLGGCAANLAGVLVNVSAAVGPATGNIVYQQAGTYNYSALGGAINAVGSITIAAYTTVPGDGIGFANNVKTIASTGALFTFTNTGTFFWQSINFSDTSATKGTCFLGQTTNSLGWKFYDCIIDGFSVGYNSSLNARGASSLFWLRSIVRNCTTGVADSIGPPETTIIESQFYNNTSSNYAYIASNSSNILTIAYSIFGKSANGFADSTMVRGVNWQIINNTFVDCTSIGFGCAETGVMPAVNVYGNIFYNCGTGVKFAYIASPLVPLANDYNAYGANGTDRVDFPVGPHDIALTADPFNNRATFDYTLNNVAGGGALCRNALPTGQDVGALQHLGSAAGGQVSYGYSF